MSRMREMAAVVGVGLALFGWSGIALGAPEAQLTVDSNMPGTAGSPVKVPMTYVASDTGPASAFITTITKDPQWSLDISGLSNACTPGGNDCSKVSTGLKQIKVGTGVDANRIALIEEVTNPQTLKKELIVAVIDTRSPSLGLGNPTIFDLPLAIGSSATGTLPVAFDATQTNVASIAERAASIATNTNSGSIVVGGSPSTCDRNTDGQCNLNDVFDVFAIWVKADSGGTLTANELVMADLVPPTGVVDLSDVFEAFSRWVANGGT